MDKKIHMPTEFSIFNKPLVVKYMSHFKHSMMAKKLLMCAYYAARYFDGYISFETFISSSIRQPDEAALLKHWNMQDIDRYSYTFFGFNKKIIAYGDMHDLECHMAEILRFKDVTSDNTTMREMAGVSKDYAPPHVEKRYREAKGLN